MFSRFLWREEAEPRSLNNLSNSREIIRPALLVVVTGFHLREWDVGNMIFGKVPSWFRVTWSLDQDLGGNKYHHGNIIFGMTRNSSYSVLNSWSVIRRYFFDSRKSIRSMLLVMVMVQYLHIYHTEKLLFDLQTYSWWNSISIITSEGKRWKPYFNNLLQTSWYRYI